MPFATDPPPAADIAALASRVQAHFLRDASPGEVLDALLPEMLAATRSAHGFIGEVAQADDGATLTVLAVADTAALAAPVHATSLPGAEARRDLDAQIGAAYPVDLWAHCPIDLIQIAGSVWRAKVPYQVVAARGRNPWSRHGHDGVARPRHRPAR
jgi:GAF domain-containing protein